MLCLTNFLCMIFGLLHFEINPCHENSLLKFRSHKFISNFTKRKAIVQRSKRARQISQVARATFLVRAKIIHRLLTSLIVRRAKFLWGNNFLQAIEMPQLTFWTSQKSHNHTKSPKSVLWVTYKLDFENYYKSIRATLTNVSKSTVNQRVKN